MEHHENKKTTAWGLLRTFNSECIYAFKAKPFISTTKRLPACWKCEGFCDLYYQMSVSPVNYVNEN